MGRHRGGHDARAGATGFPEGFGRGGGSDPLRRRAAGSRRAADSSGPRPVLARRGEPSKEPLRAARRPARPVPPDHGHEARRRGARRLRARVVGPRPQRSGAGARLPRAPEGPLPPGAGRRLRPLPRRRLRHRQEGVRGRPELHAAGALREGAHRRGLRRPLHRPLVLRRAQPRDGARHLQGDALAGAGALGNDGLRLDPRPRLAADARRRGRLADRDPRHVDGQLDGAVAGRPRRTREGDGGHLLPHRVPRAPRGEGPRTATASTTTCPAS